MTVSLFSKETGVFSTASACALSTLFALFPISPAEASLARPTPGAQNVRLKLDFQTRKSVDSGLMKVGSKIPMSLVFDVPQDSSCSVRIIFKPVAGTAEAQKTLLGPQGDSSTSSKEAQALLGDSALGPFGRIYQMSCGQYQIGSRVSLPFTFTSIAKPGTGSAVDASVEIFGGKGLVRAIGYATLVLGADDGGVLKISSTEAINQAQRERIFKDPEFQLKELVATETLPLDEKTVPAAMSVDVSDVPKDPSKAQ